jgi:hypothetical protein
MERALISVPLNLAEGRPLTLTLSLARPLPLNQVPCAVPHAF